MSLILILCGDIHPHPGPNQLQICHVNMRSLMPGDRHVKLDDLHSTLCIENNSDVICISETWLDDTIDDSDVIIPGYQLFRRDRNRHGGGVAIYIKDVLPVKEISELKIEGIEIVGIEIKFQTKNFIVACCYRPPGSRLAEADEFLDKFQDCINIMYTKNVESIFVLGDFNDRCIDWNDNHHNSELGLKLKKLIANNIMFQIINDPTHNAPNYSSLLDLIITDSPGYILDSGVGHPLGDPYHCYIYCKVAIQYPNDKTYVREIWKYNEGDMPGLLETLSTCPWQVMDVYDDLDDMVDYFTKLFLETCKEYIPYKSLKINPKDKPWMNKQVKFKLKERNKYYRRWKKAKTDLKHQIFIQKRNEANLAMLEAKMKHFTTIKNRLCSTNVGQKEYWHLIKTLYGTKIDGGIPSLIEGEDVISTAGDKAHVFNMNFLSKAKLPDILPTLPGITNPEHTLSSIKLTEENVMKILKGLNVKKANGPDNISNKLLKDCADVLAKPLLKIFQYSLSIGKFPSKWKEANVVPIHKKNSKQDKNNYRPISLLSTLGKVFERLIFNSLYKFCKENDLLTWRNSGYKPLDSSMYQLIYISNNIYKALEQGKDVCMVSLDATAAFDRVWHDGLLYKLRCKGIKGKLFDWFQSYLSNRVQRVVIRGQFSSWEHITAGVPQGSILGPLLFLIYIDDIVKNIESDICLFADDTALLEVIVDPILSFDKINRDLVRLNIWSEQWLVSFNPTKTQYIVFTKKLAAVNYPSLFLGQEKLNEVKSHKQLGVTFTKYMKFDEHIDNICSKAMQRLTALKKIGSKLSRKNMRDIYLSFIRPILEFGWQLYINSSAQKLNELEKVQRSAIIFVTGAYRHTNHTSVLKEAGVLLLSQRREELFIKFMHNHYHDKVPEYLSATIPETVGERNRFNLRNASNIRPALTRKNYLLKSFIPSAIKAWNDAKPNFRRATSMAKLKTELKNSHNVKLYLPYLEPSNKGLLLLSRIRMGLSGLNFHRKKYHFITDSSCLQCNARKEDPMHYLLFCPAYRVARVELLRGLRREVPETIQYMLYVNTKANAKQMLSLLTVGTQNSDVDVKIFSIVSTFIQTTQRFM